MPASLPGQDIINNPQWPQTRDSLSQAAKSNQLIARSTKKHISQVLNFARDKAGKLASHAWPGCYPIVFGNALGHALCPRCANNNLDDFPESDPISCTIHYEGEPIECDRCGTLVDSAYGDPLDDQMDLAHCANCDKQLTNTNVKLATQESALPQDCLTLYCPSYTVEGSDSGPYASCVYHKGDDQRPAIYRVS
jgi:hypothetical protein